MNDVLMGTAPGWPWPARLAGTGARLSRRGTALGSRCGEWELTFPPRWRGRIDHLTGWWGGGDPLASLRLRFPSREAAEAYARRQGICLEVSAPGEAGRRAALPCPPDGLAVAADPSLPWAWDGRGDAAPPMPAPRQEEKGGGPAEHGGGPTEHGDEPAGLDLEAALADPASVFPDPMAVAAHPRLTRAQKLEILARWEWDARLIEVAQAEGMPDAGEPSRLEEILAARRSLGARMRPGDGARGMAPRPSGAGREIPLAA